MGTRGQGDKGTRETRGQGRQGDKGDKFSLHPTPYTLHPTPHSPFPTKSLLIQNQRHCHFQGTGGLIFNRCRYAQAANGTENGFGFGGYPRGFSG